MSPPWGLDIIFLAWMNEGGGFSWEYEVPWVGDLENPCAASTTAGGTVIRPILKQSREIATACKIVPSGSCMTPATFGLSPLETACRVLPVSVAEARAGSAGVPEAIVNSPSAGIRREATKGIDSATLLSSLRLPIFAADSDPRFDLFGLVRNLNATYSYI